MKRFLAVIIVSMICLSLIACAKEKERMSKEDLKTSLEKFSYALGMDMGARLKNMNIEVEIAPFLQGAEDELKGNERLMTAEEASEIRRSYAKQLQEGRVQQMKEVAESNRIEGEKFLEENGKKEGVVTTASGLQYVVLSEGKGPMPKASDRVKVHYQGTLIDGTEFDSSYKRGNPATFQLDRVIAGWTEGLQLMRVGSKYRLFIPSSLGYGERGAGRLIGPNATLIFEVELLSIEK